MIWNGHAASVTTQASSVASASGLSWSPGFAVVACWCIVYFSKVLSSISCLASGDPDGIIYSSSREGGERAFVLFCENEQCFAVEDGPVFLEQLLNLTAVAHEQT